MTTLPPSPIRAIIAPDPGYILVEGDLERADLQVVVWEADDTDLKAKLRAGVDIHRANAEDIFGAPVTEHQRFLAKSGVHGTNYGGSPNTMAAALHTTRAGAAEFQRKWFEAHPGILAWHKRVKEKLEAYLPIANAFGYQIIFQERPGSAFTNALAWGPQSTVALVTNKGWKRLWDRYPRYQVLLQNHDALLLQVPENTYPECLAHIEECMRVEIPYEDPLTIGIEFKMSPISWGHAEKVK